MLHRLGAPVWARDMQLLCVRTKAGQEDRHECLWTNFKPEISKNQRLLPPSVQGQIKAIADAASLSFRALDHKIDNGLAIVARDWNALIPYLLEMQRGRFPPPANGRIYARVLPQGLHGQHGSIANATCSVAAFGLCSGFSKAEHKPH